MTVGVYAPRRFARPLVMAFLLAGFLGVAATLAYLRVPWNLDADPFERVATLEELRTRQVIYSPDLRVFVVAVPAGEAGATAPLPARRRGVMAFTNDAQHVGDGIRWCPSAEVFYSPAHGEKFDRFGAYMDGPAAKGLDRVAARVMGGDVYVDPTRVIPGPERGELPVREPVGLFCQN